MAVDGGTGNEISFSDLQTFYGGSNPISLSEYYRGGSEVPGEQVTAQANTSGTSDQTIGEFTADVTSTSTFTGALGSITSRVSTSVSNNSGGSSISDTYTVLASDSVLILSGGGQNNQGGDDPPDPTGSWSTSGVINISPVASGQGKFYKGPAYQSGDSSDLTFSGSISAGTFTITSSVGTAGGGVSVSTRRRASVTTHDVDFTNNSSVTITTTSGSTDGNNSTGSLTFTAGQTRKVKDNASSNSYVLGYDAVNGNTNVPASGTINMDVFNAPGTPTP